MTTSAPLLAEPSFRTLFVARTVSVAGSAVAPVAIAFAVLGSPGLGAGDLGVVLAARAAGQVAFLLYGGVLADRLSRGRLMLATELLAGVAQGGLAAAVLSGHPPVPLMAALAAVGGAAAGVFLPAIRGALPQVVRTERLQQANALLRISDNVVGIGGALAAGLLVTALGAGTALLVDAATFMIAGIWLWRLRSLPPAGGSDAERHRWFADVRQGWSAFLARRWLVAVVLQFAAVNACLAALSVLGPLVAQARMGGALGWSAILAAQAAGFLLGSLLALRLSAHRPVRAAVLATFGFVPPFVLLATGAPVAVVAVSALLGGLCQDVFSVLWATALQIHVPDDVLSRIVAFDTLGSFAVGPPAIALAGPLAETYGPEPVLAAAAAVMVLATATALAVPAVRQLPARPQPVPVLS